MKKMWKRFVSLLLACTLLAGMLPLSASAQATAPESGEAYEWVQNKIKEIQATVPAGETQYTVGKTYRIGNSDVFQITLLRSYQDNEGNSASDAIVLILPGDNGENYSTPDYNSAEGNQPWAQSHPSQIYIAKGVTGIGNYTFASNSNMNKVVFQDASDLTYIGQRAFFDDDNAVFTDEGNGGDNAPLDLSGVTRMGEYAFYNCDRLTGVELGNMTAIEGNEEIANKIPNNAFNNSGLQTVTIPEGIVHIGNGAFGHTSLSKVEELVLPDSLLTIGDNAFVVTMGSGDTSVGITSLTIPSSVTSIGENAFSGRRQLAEVTVEDDNKPGTTLELGNHAFGHNESSAFSEYGSITDAQNNITYRGTIGTKFYLPEDLVDTFKNGENCYTGDIEPMKWVKTQQPTCDTDGWHLYETTMKGAYDDEGNPLVLQYKYIIGKLGHDYKLNKSFSATCETESYELWVCTRDETHTENREIGVDSKAKGHNYQLTKVDDTEMGGGNDTIFTWVCQTLEHDDTRDSLDKTLEITINPATIQANTSMTVGDLANRMPQVVGGKLSLAEDENLNAALTTDTKSVRVVFTPDEVKYANYTNVGAVSEFNNADLTLEVNVSKAKLDFSDVNFGNTRVFVDSTASEGTPITVYRGSLPDDVAAGKPLYSNDIGSSEEEPPARNSTWSGMVSVTFTYDPQKYEVDTEKKPGSNYTFDTTEEGKVTITHPYVIVEQTMNELAAAPIQPLTYKADEAQETVHLSGVPYSSTVSWTWEEVGNVSNSKSGIVTSPSNQNAMDIAPIMDAGTYSVTITVEKDGYEPKTLAPVTVTIAKATVVTPTAPSDLQYTGKVQTGLQEPGQDAHYEYTEGSQLTGTNAGTYKATAQLDDPDNYQWSSGDDNRDGTVEITWNIAKRRVIETSINSVYKDQTTSFTGTPITAVSPPSSTSSGFFDVTYDNEGNLVGKIKNTDTVAFKISHAQETNAKTYTVIASIEDFANFCWQNHPENKNVTLGTWTIGKLQIAAPTIAAEDVTYTGAPYAGMVSLAHSVKDAFESSSGIIDLDATKSNNIRYYNQETGGTALKDTPVDAGTYYAGVENWEFVTGKLGSNYQIIGEPRDAFTINKAIATMTFSPEEVTATYTAQGTDLQPVTVTGLVDADKDNPASEVYTVTYTYKYRTDSSTTWEEVNTETKIEEPNSFKFTNVGEYQITATFSSQNYTAADATYTLTITQANDQKITLTSAETNAGKWDVENNSYTTIYGSEKTFTVTGKAALDKENADISYAVNGDSNVVSVDGSSGVVTIHKAGTATITVTAADTDNVTGTSVNYTVTVNRAKPTVNTGLPDDELTVAYTGEAITDTEYNKATATANVVKGADQPTGAITYTFYRNEGCTEKFDDGAGGNVPIAVGTYYMKASYPGDTNYESAESEPVTVTVAKAQLTVDAEGHTGTYDGTEYPPITVNSVKGNSEEITGYTVKYAVTNNDTAPNENAGEEVWKGTLPVKDVADSSSGSLYYWYMVTADNYNPAIGKVDVKIAPAPLTVAGEPTRYTKEYDGDKAVDEAFDKITVTAENVPDVTIDVAATGTYADKNAGEGKNVTLNLTLSGTDTWGNYSYNGTALTEGEITLTKAGAGTITPKEITVTGISAENRVYDGTKVVQLTGTPATEDTLFNGDNTVSLALAEGAKGQLRDATAGNGKAVSVGNDAVKITGEGSGNYSVKVSLPNLTVDIEKATPTVTITGASENKLTVAYTGNPVSVVATVAGISATDKPTGEVTFRSYESAEAAQNDTTGTGGAELEEMPSNGGPYYLRACIAKETNYKAAVSDYVELVIDATALSVTTGEPAEKSYTGKEYNMAQWAAMKVQFSGKDVQYDVVFLKKGENETSAPNAEDEKWNSGVSAITNVAESGEYWYKVTAREGEGNFKPYVSTSAITFTVTPATLTLSSSLTEEKKYNGTTVAAVTKGSVEGAQNSENITVSSVSAAYDNANVGTGKTITTTYEVTFGAGVTPGNYTYDGDVDGKDTSTWTIKTTVENGKITQAPITVAINDQKKVYDGQSLSIENPVQDTHWSTTGTIYLQDGVKDDLGITLSIASDSDAKDAGTYAITGKWTNSNYDVTFTGSWTGKDANEGHAGTYTIDHRPISVQIGDAEGFYGDEPVLDNVELVDDTEDGVSDAGLVVGEVLKDVLKGLELATAANAQSDISDDDITYSIYAKKGEAPIQAPTQLGNYNVTFTQNGTYTVKQRPITITIADHSSKYGAEINGGIADPVSGRDYTVAITNQATTGDAIVKGDNLEIKLTTEATADSPVDDYDIIGSAEGNKVNNYAITWAGNGGNRDGGGKNGRYTIEEAELAISFEKGNQVPNGVSINITDSYNDNPLVLENASTNDVVSDADKATLNITYSIGVAGGGDGDVSRIAEINETTGEVTIHSTGTVRVTAKVTANKGSNYTGTQTTWYELNIISGGQMALNVTPATGLKYTGEAQNLLAREASCTVAGAEIQYSLDNQDWGDEIPTGTNAGTYTVYVKATDPNSQYSDVTEHVTVTIAKADLVGKFDHDRYTHVLVNGNSYDSAQANPLDLSANQNYTEDTDAYTYRSNDTGVAIAVNGGSTIRVLGSAGDTADITVTVPGDDNYNGKTFTYKLEISDDLSKIVYSVEDEEATYNGQPQTIEVNVSVPASGATVKYWNEETKKYDLSEPPAYTDVKDSGTTIKFQITAPGYNTEEGTATLTIEPKEITETMIAGIAESYTYTGKEITFDDAISVHDEGVLLEKDKDYTITYDDNKEVGKGSVTITGTGNYKESVTKNFEITPVDASDLTASLDRTFGYYDDSNTNNATVTVTHGSHTVDSSEITLTVTRQDSTIESGDVVQEGLKLTFNKAGIYTIHVVVSGTHTGAFDLTYTLLPQDVASDDFQVATDPVDRVWTYDGGNHAFGVTVTSGGTPLQKDVDFTLRYTYLPYVGSQEESEYDPESTEFTEAGIYTVIVEGIENYTGHAELVALIQPRDLSDAGITATFAQTELVYNGEAQEPGVTLTYNGTAITQLKDTEYYGNTNAGEAQALSAASAGCNNFTGARVDAFTIEKKSLNDSTITAKADPEKYYYTGYPVTPAVTVTDSGRNVGLSIGADYTVSSDAVGPGKVTATVTGTGNYKDTVTVEFTILPTGAEPVETLNLTVTPSEWTWDNGQTKAAISVTFNGTELNDTDYQLTVSKDGETPQTVTKAEAVQLLSAPGTYTITATGVGAYNGSTDTETVTIQKIQPKVTVTATPNSLSGGGKVTLTLKGEKLPDGTDLKNLLKVTAKNDSDVTLEDLHIQWPQDGSLTAELTLPNTSETYTFTLTFTGNEYYEAATASEQVVVAQQIISGGGGGPVEDQPANPDDTGVSDWLNTKEHLAYLAGYPGGTFGPDQNMTRAEAAQMFYNLLLEKDVEITVEFEDVPADAWYAKPVNTLASLGILSGVGNGRFDPERSITRAEFTVIAMKFANTSGGGVNIFSDVNEDDWFYSAVVDSTQYGWINGYPDGTFRPEATISRAEVTVIVNHMLGRAADRPYVIAHEEELNTFGDVNRGHWGYFHVAEATNAHEYHTEDGTESWTGLS